MTTAQRLRSVVTGARTDRDAFAQHSSRCAEEIEQLAPDVVLAHSCQFFRVPALATYLTSPAVCYLHEPNRRFFEVTSGAPWTATDLPRIPAPKAIRTYVGELLDVEVARLEVRDETRSLRDFDRVLTNSAFSRESILRAYGQLSTACPPGIDTARFSVQKRPTKVRGSVLTVGAFIPEKNPEFLIRAVAAAGPDVRQFTWVANIFDKGLWSQLKRVAVEVGVTVDLREAVSEQELTRCFADADVFVYAPRLEPFGLAPLEANATGLPVLGVAEGGVRESLVDGVNGVVVSHDEKEFAAALAELLSVPGHARALGRRARQHVVETWSLPASIRRLEHQLELAVLPQEPAEAVGGHAR